MSSRLREALDDLQREVADLRLAPPRVVRDRGDALRRRRVAGVALSTALAAGAVGAAALTVLLPPASTPGGAPASVPPTCATAAWEDQAALATGTHVRVFMKLEATAEQIEGVRQTLVQLDLPFQFVDHDEAYEEFKRLYACEPELVRRTEAENLPEWFSLTLPDLAQFPAVRDQLLQLPGVEHVSQAPQ